MQKVVLIEMGEQFVAASGTDQERDECEHECEVHEEEFASGTTVGTTDTRERGRNGEMGGVDEEDRDEKDESGDRGRRCSCD